MEDDDRELGLNDYEICATVSMDIISSILEIVTRRSARSMACSLLAFRVVRQSLDLFR